MEDDNGEKKDPGAGDANPQNPQLGAAHDSFMIHSGGQEPSSGLPESPSTQEEQPGAGPTADGPGPVFGGTPGSVRHDVPSLGLPWGDVRGGPHPDVPGTALGARVHPQAGGGAGQQHAKNDVAKR